jgi:hypothetical protein
VDVERAETDEIRMHRLKDDAGTTADEAKKTG